MEIYCMVDFKSGAQWGFIVFFLLCVVFYLWETNCYYEGKPPMGVIFTKFDDPQFSYSFLPWQAEKISFPPQFCIHMWPVEPHAPTGTAVSGHYWDAGLGQWIQLIIAAVGVSKAGISRDSKNTARHDSFCFCFKTPYVLSGHKAWEILDIFRLMVESVPFTSQEKVSTEEETEKSSSRLEDSESQPPSVCILAPWQVFITMPESVSIPHWYCIWHLRSSIASLDTYCGTVISTLMNHWFIQAASRCRFGIKKDFKM